MIDKLGKLTSLLSNRPKGLSDPSAFEVIYREHQNFIRTSLYWMVRDDGVDDLVQETFKKAWMARDSFKGNSSLKTWLYRIAMNAAKDYLRKRSSLQENNDVSTDELQNPGLEMAESMELKNSIDCGLNALTIEQRELFILFYKLNFTYKEISQIKEIPIGTVKSQLFSCREKFLSALKKQQVTYA